MATILLFAKEPIPGQVKTRLVPSLTPDEAAELATAFLRDLHATLSGIADVELVLAIPDDSSADKVASTLDSEIRVVRQGPGGLGERVARATSREFEGSPRPVAVVGSDHPDLPRPLVEACLADARGGSVGWIPTEDGGYAAIALPRALPSLFQGVPWSTGDVAAATRDNAARLDLELKDHGPWYDVDTVRDLQRLSRVLEASDACPWTRETLARLDPPLAEREERLD
jgi:rSAM/selenodomain-associated transferase 1